MAPIQKVGGTNWNALPLECCYCLQPMAWQSRLCMLPCELSCYEENSNRWVAPIQKVAGTNWNAIQKVGGTNWNAGNWNAGNWNA